MGSALPVIDFLQQKKVAEALRTFLPERSVLWQQEDTRPYECDGLTAYRRLPMVVALPENDEQARNITHQLYGGDRRTRIEQEIVLGVGGVRALEAMELRPTVWHINEGHAAFLALEHARAGQTGTGLPSSTRGRGSQHGVHDSHSGACGSRPLRRRHDVELLRAPCQELKLSRDEFLALGRANDSRD